MGYYDNVKDDVENKGSSSSTPSFDTLKEAAQETSEEEKENPEAKGDDTPIEVLEEGLSKNKSSSQQSQSRTSTANQGSSASQAQQQQPVQAADTSNLEDKLDRIIEQNQRMIEILESFGS